MQRPSSLTPWQAHVQKWRNCQLCPLCKQRDKIVLGRGTVPAEILALGEAPGASEDVLGQPFVGPAGKMLDMILQRALHNSIQEVDDKGVTTFRTPKMAMTNLVACFPADAKAAGTNEPEKDEIVACRPRLAEFIAVCQPRLVVCVGSLATSWVWSQRSNLGLTDIETVSVLHPAFILRAPVAQQSFMVQKSIVTISTAVENLPSLNDRPQRPLLSPFSSAAKPENDGTIPF